MLMRKKGQLWAWDLFNWDLNGFRNHCLLFTKQKDVDWKILQIAFHSEVWLRRDKYDSLCFNAQSRNLCYLPAFLWGFFFSSNSVVWPLKKPFQRNKYSWALGSEKWDTWINTESRHQKMKNKVNRCKINAALYFTFNEKTFGGAICKTSSACVWG